MNILMDELINAARIPAKVVRHEFDDTAQDVRARALLHDVKRRRLDCDLNPEYVRSVQAAAVADSSTSHQLPPKPAQPEPAQQPEQPPPQPQPEQQAQPAQP
jgi:hypothetical protein